MLCYGDTVLLWPLWESGLMPLFMHLTVVESTASNSTSIIASELVGRFILIVARNNIHESVSMVVSMDYQYIYGLGHTKLVCCVTAVFPT